MRAEGVPGTAPVPIIHIIHKFDRRAGPDVMLVNQLSRMDRARWLPSLFLIDFERYEGQSELEQALPGDIRTRTVAWRRGRGLPRVVAGLRAMIHETDARLVHSHDIPSHVVAAFAQNAVRRVASVHGIVDQTTRQHVWNAIARLPLLRADHVVFGSPQIREHFPFVDADRSSVIWNAIDTGHFAHIRRDFKRMRFSARRPLRLVCIARLSEEKGHAHLIEAMRLLAGRPVTLDIAGTGPLRDVLEQQIRSSGLTNVRLLGFVEDTATSLESADIYCLASVRESLPLGVLEAMASGLPVIATDVGALHEVVAGNGCGIVVPPADPQALADAIASVIDHPEQLNVMSHHGRDSVEATHSARAYTARTSELYERLIQQPR